MHVDHDRCRNRPLDYSKAAADVATDISACRRQLPVGTYMIAPAKRANLRQTAACVFICQWDECMDVKMVV